MKISANEIKVGNILEFENKLWKVLKLEQNKILEQEKNISALSIYWTFLLIVWLMFFLMIYVFNDAVIAWCKSLIT